MALLANDAFQTVLIVVSSVLEKEVISLWTAIAAKDNLSGFLGGTMMLFNAVPSPFPYLVAIVGSAQ